MGKTKKGGGTAPSTKGTESLEAKKRQRAAQSERDSKAAREADGWEPSGRTKDKVEFKHRCEKCLNPSAACRRGSKICARCGGAAARSRKRQVVRDGGKVGLSPSAATKMAASPAAV